MKYITGFVRLIVGVLFIISGLIKLNDPIGFSIKLSEYFSEEVLNLTFLEPFVLWLALFVVVYEILLGVFLLIGFKPKLTLWGLLLMIVFFTFLTFYSAYFNKVTDCGCFGDAIKLTPWGSFTKDIVLLALILILFAGIRHIKPIFSKLGLVTVSMLSFLACIWFGNHVINHLPIIDFRPYKIGTNIAEGMVVPEDAPKAVVEYSWKFNVDGKEQIITTNGSYPTVDGDFVGVETRVIQEGYTPPIHDFSIERNGDDYTNTMLHEPHLIVVVAYDLSQSDSGAFKRIKTMTDNALKQGYKVIGMTASGTEQQQKTIAENNLNFNFYFCDATALKTIVRANPGVLKLAKGTIEQKVHWKDVDAIALPEVQTPEPDIIAYYIDEKLASKEAMDSLKPETIERMDVFKTGPKLDSLNQVSNVNYKGIIKITLKNQDQ